MNTALVIDAPLRGEWAVLNPPGHPKLAFDFLASKGSRLPYRSAMFPRHLLGSISVRATFAWGQPVYAPLDGIVVACSDGAPDRERISMLRDLVRLLMFPPHPGSPFQAYGGNYVVLKCGNVYPLLAHLRCGSLRVKLADRVRAGQQLGEVGNSGSSIQPHLHFQVMSDENPFPLFRNLVPFKLRELRKKVGGEWKKESNAELRNGDHLQL
jgi:Peptidase family M23